MIVNGWLDWAVRLPGPVDHTNQGVVNANRGLFMHSAEGYASTLLDPNSEWGYRGGHSWHLSNLMDGRVVQHYPFTACTWHATKANNSYVGVENEGRAPKEASLNAAQIANAQRFIREISEHYGWTPTRLYGNTTQTLWEHNEVTWIGGSGSACPSGRIPWAKILAGLEAPPVDEEERRLYAAVSATLLRDYTLKSAGVNPAHGKEVVQVVNKDGTPCDPPIWIALR